MPRGSKAKYTPKQRRKAEHIEESYEQRGLDPGEAEARAWATVNKQDGGGEQGGSGRRKAPQQKAAARQDSARRAASARKGHPTHRGRVSARCGNRSAST